jgi:hypothetical protein
MPVIKEMKLSPELKQRFDKDGPCLRVGVEIWTLEGTRLRVGKVKKIIEGKGVQIEFPGRTVLKTPEQCLIMTKGTKI